MDESPAVRYDADHMKPQDAPLRHPNGWSIPLAHLRLTIEPQDALLAWARDRCGVIAPAWPANSEAMGVMDGERIRAVMVINMVVGGTCCVHFASDGSRSWASRGIIAGLFAYPFIFKNLHRVQLQIPRERRTALVAAVKLGFQFEGITRAAGPRGEDLVTMSMIRAECPYIREGGVQ